MCAQSCSHLVIQIQETVSKPGSSSSPREAWIAEDPAVLHARNAQEAPGLGVCSPAFPQFPPECLTEEEVIQLAGEEPQAPDSSSCTSSTELCLSHFGTVISGFLSSFRYLRF